uniref:Uncharacterized protein n=1 Tax=Timema shepardi TaxID=629360 RepID=A0A7R9AQ65_TIMSH|nr:unnamed protein product [Timema shepardi]
MQVDALMYVRDLRVNTGVLVSKHPLNQVFGVDVKVQDIMETAVKMLRDETINFQHMKELTLRGASVGTKKEKYLALTRSDLHSWCRSLVIGLELVTNVELLSSAQNGQLQPEVVVSYNASVDQTLLDHGYNSRSPLLTHVISEALGAVWPSWLTYQN